jgi:[methyl-Co(III) methanol-specific corrinoid protein]:coenzyme M methyltransferase
VLSPKERLLAKLNKQPTDRTPVICPGGMMNAAVVDIMKQTGHTLPEAHSNQPLMTELAADVHKYSGFENIGIPFCMTVEAEVLGSEVTYGTLACEPKITREVFASAADVKKKNINSMLNDGRVGVVLETASVLSRKYSDIPVIGSLTGPVSTAASLIDPMMILREFRKKPAECHRVMEYVTELLISFAQRLVESGASVISIADPTATGEILGPVVFRDFAVPYLNKIIDAMKQQNVPVIVHICGNLSGVWRSLPSIRASAISTDAFVSLKQLKTDFPEITTMGNLSTYLLEFGTADKVADQTRRLVDEGIDIIAPACGLSTSTSLELIRSMTGAVKEG